MHSLKELRAENAAKRLSDSRTAGEDDITAGSSPATAAATAAAAAAAATTAPRVARTLAPLTSTGSLPPGAAAEPAVGDDDKQQEDREARRRRRLRRRREREQRENEYEDNSKINADDNTTAASGISRASTTPGEANMKGTRTVTGAAMEEKGGVHLGKTSARPEEKTFDGEKESAAAKNDGFEKPQLSARGEPPPEKPNKRLTPLEARRARIEQQKREEIERNAGGSNQSPRSAGPEQAKETPETKSDAESEGEAVVHDGRQPSDGRKSNSTTNPTGQRRAIRSAGRGGDEARKSEEEEDVSGTEHDPLIATVRSAGGRTEKKNEDHNNGGAGRNSSEDSQEEHNTPPVENARKADGDAEAGDTPHAIVDGGLLGDAAGGDGGRFQGMRSRMKKAGQGLLPKKNSGSSARRRKGTDDAAAPGGVGGKDEEQPEAADNTNSGETLPDTGGGRQGRTREAGEGDGGLDGGGQKPREEPADESGTASNDNALSPVLSEAEKDGSLDTDDSDEGGKGRKKKWRRSKDKGSAEAPSAGDKEVTLGHVVDRKMREMGYIRKPAVDELKSRRSLRDRVAAEGAPEVHFIGEISGAEGFGSGVSCRFRIEGGRHWTCLAGLEEGQTHVMHTDYGETFAPWNHPIDLHYTTKSIQGWPRLMVQVWELDTHGRNVLRGYGFRHLPSTPGFSEVSVPCWRPSGTMQEETAAFFLGVTPRLTAEDAVFNRAWDQRCRLVTLPAGTVWIQVNGLFCNLQDQGVDNL